MAMGSMVIPSMRYRDAQVAMVWLEAVLGFARKAVYDGPDGTVAHAELVLGTGMMMLGSASNVSPYPDRVGTPADLGGRVTSPMYVVVEDCEPVWVRAQAAGAEVLQELRTMSYGGKAFTVADPEGYVWAVGEYDPWKGGE
jgi:uncharacterized glyoxalase superfamily protein PhnB